jgi:hypothetical protein
MVVDEAGSGALARPSVGISCFGAVGCWDAGLFDPFPWPAPGSPAPANAGTGVAKVASNAINFKDRWNMTFSSDHPGAEVTRRDCFEFQTVVRPSRLYAASALSFAIW